MILRKGNLQKDRHTTNRLVGVQRHTNYNFCAVFATARKVIQILCSDPLINFMKPKKERASWWDIPLNHYNSYNKESNSMKDVLNKSCVESTKVTHHCTQAVQFAGSKGLTMEQVTTLIKHITNKIVLIDQWVLTKM